jgi:hypothetical protein
MKFVEIEWTPNARQLRQFSAISVVSLPAISWLWGAGPSTVSMVAAVSCAIGLLGMVAPQVLKYPYLAASLLAMPIGLVVGELVMASIYFGCFVPIGLFFRVRGRDALRLKLNRNAASYWESKDRPRNAGSYYQQF